MAKHINTFLSKVAAAKCWPRIFKAKDSLNILNILHLVELSIAFPLSNECVRIFSFIWRLYTKERLSLGNDTIEALLRLRGDTDFTASNYDRAIDKVLSRVATEKHNPNSRTFQDFPGLSRTFFLFFQNFGLFYSRTLKQIPGLFQEFSPKSRTLIDTKYT